MTDFSGDFQTDNIQYLASIDKIHKEGSKKIALIV